MKRCVYRIPWYIATAAHGRLSDSVVVSSQLDSVNVVCNSGLLVFIVLRCHVDVVPGMTVRSDRGIRKHMASVFVGRLQ